jgi:aryl-alcohol dehydrogenase-like predicted oxidoreductase
VLPLCEREQVADLVFSPLAGGWLTGKYRRGEAFPAGSRMTQRPDPYEAFVNDATFDRLERLADFAAADGRSLPGLALAWLLADARVTQVVVGPGRPEHLAPVREALERPLSPAQREEVARC